MRDHDYYVYILTNKQSRSLYIGVTNNLERRIAEHKAGEVEGFSQRYQLKPLVWFEHFRNVSDAIACEKKLKGWLRSKKNALIEKYNPRWCDLSANWAQEPNIDRRCLSVEEMIGDPSLRSG